MACLSVLVVSMCLFIECATPPTTGDIYFLIVICFMLAKAALVNISVFHFEDCDLGIKFHHK